jgi:hypothetical protein
MALAAGSGMLLAGASLHTPGSAPLAGLPTCIIVLAALASGLAVLITGAAARAAALIATTFAALIASCHVEIPMKMKRLMQALWLHRVLQRLSPTTEAIEVGIA